MGNPQGSPIRYTLEVPSIMITGYNDLGPEITEEFKIFYHSFMTRGLIQITQSFVDKSKSTFSTFDDQRRIALSDAYFNNFTAVTQNLLETEQYNTAFRLWTSILSFVKDWEEGNAPRTLHKGTPYYFSAVSSVLQNDFDAALMSMHNALIEDKNNNTGWRRAPAYSFLTLNDQRPDQYFKPFVDAMIAFIRVHLDGKGSQQGVSAEHYTATRAGTLTYDQFRAKFLDNESIGEEVKYYFVYSIIRIWHLGELNRSKVGDKLMAPLIFTTALFSLLLVIDDLLKGWNNPGQSRKYIREHLYELAKHENWILSSTRRERYVQDLDVNNRLEADFNKGCEELIGHNGMKYKTQNNRVLSPLEADFVLAYGLRNFSAHSIKSQEVLWNNHAGVLQSLLNCLFKTIETL